MNLKQTIRRVLKEEENEAHNRLKKYLLSKFPELKTLKSKNKMEGRYDGIHHPKSTTFYYSEDEKVWFIEYDDRDIFSSTKWEVNDELETFWELVDNDIVFEKLIKDICNIDISDKKNKKFNWQFEDMSEFVIPKNKWV